MVENLEESQDLIFFDTFSHDLHEKLNLDLVQFPSPVYISEIRIIPLGARVEADFPGGGNRLGATNPSKFDIEFYVNDLSVNVASTFEPLGKFSYNQNECINLECKIEEGIRKIPTDGLVLKGCYTTITLAVYGNIISYGHIPKIQGSNNMPTSNNVAQVSSNDEANESDNGEVYNNNFQDNENSSCDPTVSSTIDDLKDEPNSSPIDIYSRSPSKEQDLPGKNKREWSNSPDGSYRHKRSRVSGSYDRRKPIQSPRISENEGIGIPAPEVLSTTYCPSSPSMANNTPIESPTEMDEDPVELEPILSDDDISDDVNGIDDISEEIFAEEFAVKVFNPFVDELRVWNTESNVGSTVNDNRSIGNEGSRMFKVIENIKSIQTTYSDSGIHIQDTWIHHCEQINQNFHLLRYPEEVVGGLTPEVLEMIHSCIRIGLDYSLAIQHQIPGGNLRHIKAGIRLVECLSGSNWFIGWITEDKEFQLFERLFDLFPKDLIPMPIKILVARLIHKLMDTEKGINKFLEFDGYRRIIKMLEDVVDVRLLYTLKAILKKIHTDETLGRIKELAVEIFRSGSCNGSRDESNNRSKVGYNHGSRDGSSSNNDKIPELENYLLALLHARRIDVIHPRKFIPISSQFEVPSGDVADLVALYARHGFLESLILLLTVKQTLSSKLIMLIVEFLGEMTKDGKELAYIANSITMANSLVKILLESSEILEEKLFNVEIAIEIAYKIETKYHVDSLAAGEDSLEALYNLCVSPGQKFVLNFIAMDDNLAVFLNLIEKEKKISIAHGSPGFKHKSPVLSYCVDIVDFVVRHVEDLSYMKKFDSVLLNLVKHHESFEPSVAAMLQEMSVFLKPLEIEKPFDYEEISPFVDLIKRSMEFLTNFPGDLIMTLRILRFLMIGKSTGEYQELKHDYCGIQLYHADGSAPFLGILDKLTTHFDQPMIHSYLLGSNQGKLMMQVIHPTVQILRKILVDVIRTRNVNFKDVTAIETLMKTFTLMQSIHPRSPTYQESKEIQREIIRILLTYTQSLTPDGMTTTNIHKSLWTQMIGEVIKYTLNGPFHFIPGLTVLSELLPLPLPVPIQKNELGKVESQRFITERQLWSAHLHPQSHLITEMIQTFCGTALPELFQAAYRVCIQLSDLAPNMTLLVAKAVVDLIVDGNLRLFKFLAALVRHACVKVSVLSILSGKLGDLMVQVLTTDNEDQFYVLQVIHSLFDIEISMTSHVANGLPSKELITQFGSAILDCFCRSTIENVTYASIRAMILLTDHDVTFSVLKSALIQNSTGFLEKLNSIAEKCKTERKQMLLIPDLLEFFRCLTNFTDIPRTSTISISELSSLFKWNSEEFKNGSKIHFLEVFSALINDPQPEDDEVFHSENLKIDLESLLDQLRDSKEDEKVSPSDVDFPLPQAEGIVTQFSSRVAFYVTENIEDLSIDYWILSGCEDEEMPEIVQCDLDDLVRQCLPPDTNIGSDCKRLLTLSSSPQSNRERNQAGLCFRTRRVEVVDPIAGRPEKKIFGKFAPRGRGFSRAAASRGDIFRSRPPNTSRPPSLHVDDFLAMESGQPSYKRESISTSRGRGRGSSGFINRGRGISSYNSGPRGHYSSYKPSFRGRSLRGRSRGYPR